MQIHGNPHSAQTDLAGAIPGAPPAQEQDRAAPGAAPAQGDSVELRRPSIQTIVATLGASLAMELPYHPSMEPAPQEAPAPTIPSTAPAAAGPEAPASAPAGAEAAVAAENAEAAIGAEDTEETADAKGALSSGIKELSEEEQREVDELKDRDREVRAHEQAHMAAAGPYSKGGPTYEYQRGPDNRQYAVGGEVQIDTAPIPDDPEATIRKAQTIRRAALAPAEPSPQDRRVAAEAAQMESSARQEVAQRRREEMQGGGDAEGAKETEGIQATGAADTAESGTATGGQDAGTSSDGSTAGHTGKFVSGDAGDAGDLFDLMA